MAGIGSKMVRREEAAESPAYERGEPPKHDMAEGEDTGDEQEPQPNVSPEEQAQYDMVVRNALKIIYPEGEEGAQPTVSPQVLKGLSGSKEPVMNLATTAVTIVTGLRDSAKKAGQPIADDVLFHAGVAIIEELAEVAEAAKIHDYSDKDEEHALYLALDMYRSAGEQSGDVDKEALTQQWGQIVEADKQGRVGDVLPGIESRMKEAGNGDG